MVVYSWKARRWKDVGRILKQVRQRKNFTCRDREGRCEELMLYFWHQSSCNRINLVPHLNATFQNGDVSMSESWIREQRTTAIHSVVGLRAFVPLGDEYIFVPLLWRNRLLVPLFCRKQRRNLERVTWKQLATAGKFLLRMMNLASLQTMWHQSDEDDACELPAKVPSSSKF